MSNYQIINDIDKLNEFIEFLPELGQNETFYISLFARKKYFNDIPTDKAQIKRFTADKKFLLSKIRQLECTLGSYTINTNKGIIEIPNEALALYITPNPRNLRLAAKRTIDALGEAMYENKIFMPHQESLTAIQKSCTNRVYMDLDFDYVDIEATMNEIASSQLINLDAIKTIKTRGGFHILVNVRNIDKKYEKKWYNNLTKLPGCDVRGDNLLPVVGCNQGGFTPHFI